MVETSYNRVYSDAHNAALPGFDSSLNEKQFEIEINNSSIEPICKGVNYDEELDLVVIVFDDNLSDPAEIDIFNGLISAHVPEPVLGRYVMNISISIDSVDSTIWSVLTTFNFPGTLKMSKVTNIKAIGFMEEGGTSYDIRIRNTLNNSNICSKNLTNTDDSNMDLGNITNLPTGESIFEIQAKINGNSVAHIKNVNIYY